MFLKQPAKIIDRHCGSGKTNGLISSLSQNRRYLIVVPYLSEVQRVINGAAERGITIKEPCVASGFSNKREHLIEMAQSGVNICTTHAMYPLLAEAAHNGVFSDYTIIIDEVVETVKSLNKTPNKATWQTVYLGDGYATVDEATGQVSPTEKWHSNYEQVSDAIWSELYHAAKSGTLYAHQNDTLVWALPQQILKAGCELIVYTYQSQGSMMVAYFKRVGIDFEIDTDDQLDEAFRRNAKKLINVKLLKGLTALKFSYSGQVSMNEKGAQKVARTLNNLAKRDLKSSEVDRHDIIVTCIKARWFQEGKSFDDLKMTDQKARAGEFSKGSGLFHCNWLPNTTRGSNNWSNCSHVIYLYDQHPSPSVKSWLGMKGDWQDRYALSEAIQLIWRSRIRRGEPITVYFASERMYALFTEWLNA